MFEQRVSKALDENIEARLAESRDAYKNSCRYDLEKASGDAMAALESCYETKDNKRLKSQKEVYRVAGIYFRKAFGDLEESEAIKAVKGEPKKSPEGEITEMRDLCAEELEFPKSPEGESYEELRQDLAANLALGRPPYESLPDKAKEDPECLAYHMLAIMDNTSRDEEEKTELAQNYFRLFMEAYCKANEGTSPELKGINVEEREQEVRQSMLEASERDPLTNVMLIKYYELCGENEAAMDICIKAVHRFNNVHWFIYKYAENVGKAFGGDKGNTAYEEAKSLMQSLETMTDPKGEPIEKKKGRWQQRMGDFLFNTATKPEDFKKAARHYKAAEKQNGFAEYTGLGDKIEKAEKCAQAASSLDEKLKHGVLTSIPWHRKSWLGKKVFGRARKDYLEESQSDWGIIKRCFFSLLNNSEEGLYYREHVRKQMYKWFKEYEASVNVRKRRCEEKIKLLSAAMLELEEELGLSISGEEAGLIEAEKEDVHTQIARRTARLVLYEAELEPMKSSFIEAFGGEGELRKFEARVAGKNDRN